MKQINILQPLVLYLLFQIYPSILIWNKCKNNIKHKYKLQKFLYFVSNSAWDLFITSSTELYSIGENIWTECRYSWKFTFVWTKFRMNCFASISISLSVSKIMQVLFSWNQKQYLFQITTKTFTFVCFCFSITMKLIPSATFACFSLTKLLYLTKFCFR